MATAQSAVTFAVFVLVITELILAKKDYYDILGVAKDATERQIKKAFHRLAMKYHPDKNSSPDAEVRFREAAEAYETLSDETRRREYDRSGFNLDDIFKDLDVNGQNRQARPRGHFDEHAASHGDVLGRHRRHVGGGGVFHDALDDVERMFAFQRHARAGGSRFHAASKQHCRTVTQRRGNMVTTYTDCTAA